MFESRVVAETVSELRGRYSPGAAPRVALDGALDSDSVFAHEDAHRNLVQGSTLGLYMIALAVASSRSISENTRQLAAEELTEACEQCWFVQEGFATLEQKLHVAGKKGNLASFEASLLPSYRSALKKFDFLDGDRLQQLIGASEPDLDAERLAKTTVLALQTAALVLAGAAMSIPIAAVFAASAALPSARMTSHIRRNSPDLRLQSLAAHVDAEFAFHCFTRFASALEGASRDRLFKSSDQCVEGLIAELGKKAGVETEAIRIDVQVPAMLSKLEVPEDSFVYQDIQELPMEQARAVYSTVGFDAAEELVQFPPMPLEDARLGFVGQVLPQVGDSAHIVCELGPRGSDSRATVFLHVYAHEGPDPSGRLVALIHTAADTQTIPLLPTHFAAQSWSWLIGDFGIAEWDTHLLRQSGKVFAGRMHLRGSAPRPRLLEFLIPADPRTVSFSNGSSEPALALLVLQPQPEDGGCLLLDIQSIDWLESKTPSYPAFDLNCVGNALKYGYLRGIVTVLMRGKNAR